MLNLYHFFNTTDIEMISSPAARQHTPLTGCP